MRHVAVVTGASRGLGRATVDELCEGGWTVVAVVRQATVGETWPATAEVVVADVGTDMAADVVSSAVAGRPVDLLVNNAAVGAPIVDLAAADVSSLRHAFDVNVAGPMRLIQALLPNLRAAHDPLILNLSTRLASLTAQARGDFNHLPSSYAYRISKAAQNMLTISVANELAGSVRCWALHPGALLTGMALADASKTPEQAAKQLREFVETPCATSPRFCSLGTDDLDW